MWEGETVVRRCDSSQGGVKRQVCHLIENCDDHGGGEHRLGEV